MQVYRGLLSQLREELLTRIDEMTPEQCVSLILRVLALSHLRARLLVLLDESFPYISFPDLRSIPMKIIRTLKVVPRAFLVELSKDDQYYEDAPLEVHFTCLFHEVLVNSDVLGEATIMAGCGFSFQN